MNHLLTPYQSNRIHFGIFFAVTTNSLKIFKGKLSCLLYLCTMEKEHLIFGIRAIIEAIQSGKEVDKVFIQKEI